MVWSLALTVSACTPSVVPEQSGSIPTEMTANATATTINTSQASQQPTYTPVPPTPSAPRPTDVSSSPSPAPTTTVFTPSRFVIDQAQSRVSYGVGETFLSEDNRYNYAVGMTSVVSGEIMLDPNNPAASTIGDITVDISTFQSDKSRRDKAIRDRWLQSSKFPLAIFSPTELRGLPHSYEPGEVLEIEIAGNLMVRDVNRATVFTVTVSWEKERLAGKAFARVQMTDFGFDPPTIAGMIDSENDVDITLEFVALRDK